MTVPYEGSLVANEDRPGVTPYDSGFPIVGGPVSKGTDADVRNGQDEFAYVKWSDLDYEIGGAPGLVDRNAYVLGGIPVTFDAHDFQGDHAVIPRHYPYGNYGDVGSETDYANEYNLGIAAEGYPDVTPEESWADMGSGI